MTRIYHISTRLPQAINDVQVRYLWITIHHLKATLFLKLTLSDYPHSSSSPTLIPYAFKLATPTCFNKHEAILQCKD